MERLLEVARREQAKTAVELQQLQRQAGRERERAVEVVEISKAQVSFRGWASLYCLSVPAHVRTLHDDAFLFPSCVCVCACVYVTVEVVVM